MREEGQRKEEKKLPGRGRLNEQYDLVIYSVCWVDGSLLFDCLVSLRLVFSGGNMMTHEDCSELYLDKGFAEMLIKNLSK